MLMSKLPPPALRLARQCVASGYKIVAGLRSAWGGVSLFVCSWISIVARVVWVKLSAALGAVCCCGTSTSVLPMISCSCAIGSLSWGGFVLAL